MKEITVQELKKMMDDKVDFQLIDVRETYEYDESNLKGELIPMGSIIEEQSRISRDIPVVIHCRSGARSATVIRLLEERYGFTNLSNLKGGILAWAKVIDQN